MKEPKTIDGHEVVFFAETPPEMFDLTVKQSHMQDLAEAYALVADGNAIAGFVPYGFYNGKWVYVTNLRWLVKYLLASLSLAEKALGNR